MVFATPRGVLCERGVARTLYFDESIADRIIFVLVLP